MMIYLIKQQWTDTESTVCHTGDTNRPTLKELYLFIFFSCFIWEREHEQGRGRERERETQAGSVPSVHSLMQGSNSQTIEIMTWA